MKYILPLCSLLALVVLLSCSDKKKSDEVRLVSKIETTNRNNFYLGNRAPLAPNPLIKLPVTAIKPQGWLLEYLNRQRDGLTGNLGNISVWLQKKDNAWLSKDGKGEWGWEELPYWLKGYGNLGYILNDQKIIDETRIWIEGAINSQRPDGNFGPYLTFKDGTQDFWANMIMLYCLQSYYEYSGDPRVITLMTDYFKFQLTVPDNKFLTGYWQRIRGGDNLHSVMWLYNITGEKFLLELMEKIHRCTANWSSRGHSLDSVRNPKEKREGMEWPSWYGDLIDWHNVNVAQAFREPAQYFQLSKDSSHLKATYDNFHIIRKYFGQVPGGMYGSDENARPGYDDPHQGVETCGMVEQMNSDEHLFRITGDIFWADHAEEVAFNTYPAAVMPDFRSLRYITSPNMVLNDDKNHWPGISNKGPYLMMNPFSSRCCQHNHAQGWPYFAENIWMATPDNGLCAAIYSASEVSAKVGDGQHVTIKEISNYPFEETIRFQISLDENSIFPLYLRIPKWCNNAGIRINGEAIEIEKAAGKFILIKRTWRNDDEVELQLPMKISVKTWQQNHNSVSVNYGPLTFSLLIGEEYIKKESDKTAQWDAKWQKGADTKLWPSYEIHPTTNWNYGLVLNEDEAAENFTVERRPWPASNFPFTTGDVPIVIKAKGKIIPNWKIDENGLAGKLMDSPVMSSGPDEVITLVPMGAARLRVSAFMRVGEK
jgi:Beta-L-arabinofuranosidase, GH127